ncbi:hypothetical protein L9F63_024853, partial [Diploptera punctata]
MMGGSVGVVVFLAASSVHPASNGCSHVDPRIFAALLTFTGAGITRGFLVVSAGGWGKQRPLLYAEIFSRNMRNSHKNPYNVHSTIKSSMPIAFTQLQSSACPVHPMAILERYTLSKPKKFLNLAKNPGIVPLAPIINQLLAHKHTMQTICLIPRDRVEAPSTVNA